MKQEGRSMLLSVVSDLSKWPNSQITVASVADATDHLSSINALVTWNVCRDISSLVKEATATGRLFDVAFCIAPESDHCLQASIDCMKQVADRIVCVGDELIQLGGDKLAFHNWCRSYQIPTIPVLHAGDYETWSVNDGDLVVSKNRFGAGCEGIQRYQWGAETAEIVRAGSDLEIIWQRFVTGSFFSVGVIGRGKQLAPIVLPAAEQDMHWNNDIPEYRGGRIPAMLKTEQQRQLTDLVSKVVSVLKIDDGYVGLDLVWCEDEFESNETGGDGQNSPAWQLVELNPRLCTSYLGYRKLFRENLAEFWWNPNLKLSDVSSENPFEFHARGF